MPFGYLYELLVRQFESVVLSLPVGLGGLVVTYSPRDPRFVGSNPAEVNEHKSSARDLKLGVPSLRFQAR